MAIFQTPLVFVVLLFVQHSWSAPAACLSGGGGWSVEDCGDCDGCNNGCNDNFGDAWRGDCGCYDFGGYDGYDGCGVGCGEYGGGYGGSGGYNGYGGCGVGYGDCGGYGGYCGDFGGGYGGHGGFGGGGYGGYGGGYGGYGGRGYDCESSEYCDDSEYCSSNGAGYYGNDQNYYSNNQAAREQAACGQSADFNSGCYGNSNFGSYNNGLRHTSGLNDDYNRMDCIDRNDNHYYKTVDSYDKWDNCDKVTTTSCSSSGTKYYTEHSSADESCLAAESKECKDFDDFTAQCYDEESDYCSQADQYYEAGAYDQQCVENEAMFGNTEAECESEESYCDFDNVWGEDSECCRNSDECCILY